MEKNTWPVSILLRPRDNGYRFGICDNYYCSQFSWLRPLYDKEGNVGGHICASECDNWLEEEEVSDGH